ncbi:DUF2065 domain-containing protein, partial [Xanthomonas translucens]|uniref:DUF2065 domain-containing protein n=3 Tax=Xanthomonas campestris pv. translucens TaxID=343 RepID=UPI003CCE5B30
ATSSLPTLVKFERTLVQLFGLGNEVDVRPPWLLHVLEHYGLSACRTSLSTQTVKQPLDTSGFSRDRNLPKVPAAEAAPADDPRPLQADAAQPIPPLPETPMHDLIAALCLMIVFEGLVLLVAPEAWKRLAQQMLAMPAAQLRATGGVALAVGLAALWWVRA